MSWISALFAIKQSRDYTNTEVRTLDERKVDKVDGMGLSTNDFTDAEKAKVAEHHTHENKSLLDAITTEVKDRYDRLVSIFTGILSVVTTLGTDDKTLPTSKAVRDALASKVDKVSGKGLSTNDFTNALKTKVQHAISDDEKGVSGGVATLDDDGNVPASQLPLSDVVAIGTSETEESIVDENGIAHIPMIVSRLGEKRPGLVRTWAERYATAATDSGVLVALAKTVAQFFAKDEDEQDVLHEYAIISKGTLQNLMGANEPNGRPTIATLVKGKVPLSQIERDGKVLSTNDYTLTEKNKVAANTRDRHTHDNKSVLDRINATLIDTWNTVTGKLGAEHKTEDHAHAAGKIDYTHAYEDGRTEKQTDVDLALAFRSEGYAAEIPTLTTGWKRIACVMRSCNGRLGLSFTYNKWNKGRFTQNLMIEYSATTKYATTAYPSSGTPIANIGQPLLYQVSNVVCGEDPDDGRYLGRVNIIDKVRFVGIPGDSDIGNKMVGFLDVHILNKGNQTDGYLISDFGAEIKMNLVGKTWNNSVFPIYEEISVNDLNEPYSFWNNEYALTPKTERKAKVTAVLEQQAFFDVKFDRQLYLPSMAPAHIEDLTVGSPASPASAAPRRYVDNELLKLVRDAAGLAAALNADLPVITLLSDIDYNAVLTIPAGTTLDLNGQNLYVTGLTNNGTITKNSGKLWANVSTNTKLTAQPTIADVSNLWAANEVLLETDTPLDGIRLTADLTEYDTNHYATNSNVTDRDATLPNMVAEGAFSSALYFATLRIPADKTLDLNGYKLAMVAANGTMGTNTQGSGTVVLNGGEINLRVHNQSTYKFATQIANVYPSMVAEIRYNNATGSINALGGGYPVPSGVALATNGGAFTNVVFDVGEEADFSREGSSNPKIAVVGFKLIADIALTGDVDAGATSVDFNGHFVSGGKITTTGAVLHTNGGGYRGIFELIEEITADGTENQIERSADTYGNAFNLSSVVVKITGMKENIDCRFYGTANDVNALVELRYTDGRKGVAMCEVKNNMLFASGGASDASYVLMGMNYDSIMAVHSESIKRIVLFSPIEFPDGAKIKIYGAAR